MTYAHPDDVALVRAECGQPLDIRRGVAGNPVTGKLYHPACHPMSRARGAS